MAAAKPLIPVIVGPTAVGKTAVAVALRESWDLVVISADSRQVYRQLDIGTAKPTPEEQRRVPHLGIDVIEPSERYSAGRFARDAAQWISSLAPGATPVLVGGTGFYIRALVDGLFREPPIAGERRDRLRRWAMEAAGIGRWAARLDREYTAGGRQRAARAVEVALLTGRSLSWWQRHARDQGIMRPWFVHLRLPRPVLHERIARRVDDMLQRGLVDETRAVIAGGVDRHAPGLSALGYRDVVRHLEGDLTEGELRQRLVVATRRFAKRQDTWFRHQLHGHPVLPLDATEAPTVLARRILEHWHDRGQ